MEDTDRLDETYPNDRKNPFSLLDEINSKSPVVTLPLESLLDLGASASSMDNPFFEEFMDLDQLFPELPLVDTLNLGFEVDQDVPVATSDICHSDVVTVATDSTDERTDAPSPCSEIIDVVSLESDVEVFSPSGSISDIALSPESIVDVVTVDKGVVSEETITVLLDCDQAKPTFQPVAEEITVIQTSDPLTLLTQELTTECSSSLPEVSELTPSTLTVDLDELFSFSAALGLADSVVLPSVGASCESVAGPTEVLAKAEPQPKRKRTGSSENPNPPNKKSKCGKVDNNSFSEELDKRTVRRLKNNVASKHARAARKQKEQELFQQEEELEKSNAELRKQLKELELLTTSLRKVLVEKLSGATCSM